MRERVSAYRAWLHGSLKEVSDPIEFRSIPILAKQAKTIQAGGAQNIATRD